MRTPKILPGIFAVAPATILLTAQASLSAPAAEACRTNPGSLTPPGSHWYYRLNHADKRHCWYLGPVDQRASAREAASPEVTPTDAPQTATAAEPATPSPAGAPETEPVPAAQAQMTPEAVAAFLQWSARNDGGGLDFSTRWPAGLPRAQDLNASDPGAVSSGDTDARAAADTLVQTSSPWPAAEAMSAQAPPAGDTVFRVFAIAGVFAIALLLLAGWAAKFTRAPQGTPMRDRWRALASRLSARRRADLVEAGAYRQAAPRRRDTAARPPNLTDPALDVKRSLTELMHDLRRADSAADSVRSFAPRVGRPRKVAQRPTLQAAE